MADLKSLNGLGTKLHPLFKGHTENSSSTNGSHLSNKIQTEHLTSQLSSQFTQKINGLTKFT